MYTQRTYQLNNSYFGYVNGARREISLALRAKTSNDRFRHAHLAALRVSGALLEASNKPRIKQQRGDVWHKIEKLYPQLSYYAHWFLSGAQARSQVDQDSVQISQGVADSWLAMSEAYLDKALELLADSDPSPRLGYAVLAGV